MNTPERDIAGGMRTFAAIWFAELLSLTGTAMTGFALGVFVYRETGSATQFAAIIVMLFVPQILFTAVGGVFADRYSRRYQMLVANSAAIVFAVLLVMVLAADALNVIAVYGFTLLIACCAAIQFPAFASSVAVLVPKKQLGRANGMVQMANASSRMLAPALAAILLPLIDILGIVLIDMATFVFMVTTLLLVRIPQPAAIAAAAGGAVRRLLSDLRAGWAYILASPGLLRLLGFFSVANVAGGFTLALLPPLVLDFGTTADLGFVLSAEGFGWLLGAILMIAWGGPRRRVHGVLVAGIIFGVGIALLGARPVVLLVVAMAFLYAICLPIINACNAAIWQSKVTHEMQGRALGTLRMVALASVPVSALTAGLLADHVFGPMLEPGGLLAGSVGAVIGTGPGRGTALILIIVGALPILAATAAYLSKQVRDVEEPEPPQQPATAPDEPDVDATAASPVRRDG